MALILLLSFALFIIEVQLMLCEWNNRGEWIPTKTQRVFESNKNVNKESSVKPKMRPS